MGENRYCTESERIENGIETHINGIIMRRVWRRSTARSLGQSKPKQLLHRSASKLISDKGARPTPTVGRTASKSEFQLDWSPVLSVKLGRSATLSYGT